MAGELKMIRYAVIITIIASLSLSIKCFAAAVNDSNKEAGISVNTSTAKPRPKVEAVTTADFYLKDGNTVSGRLLSEDKNQVVIEQLEGSTIVTKTYGKRDIDMRTYSTRPLLESKYYIQLAEYFSAKTWDFVDDPDDFIGAIRCYENAKQSLIDSGADQEKIREIDGNIAKVKKERDVWTDQVESRAKLKKLEYDAEAENRLKRLEKQIAESNAKLNESLKSLDKTITDMQYNYKQVQSAITGMNKDFVQQVNSLQTQINENRLLINELSFRLFLSTRPAPQ